MPKPARVHMIGRARDGATGHLIGWIPVQLRTHRLKLLTLCGRNLTFTYYEESDELVGVCVDCRQRAGTA